MSIWHKKSVKHVGIAALVILMMVLAVFLILRDRVAKPKLLASIPEHVDVQVKNVVYTDVGADGTKWEVRADTGTYYRKDSKALLDNVTVKLVMSNGRSFVLTGDKGIMGTENKNIDISGHVTILSDRGDRITMDDLHYNDKKRIFTTDSVVNQENSRMKIQGKGMELSLVKKEMKLLSDVRALMKAK
ncbi:MAG: LPS export ABC transporter periplasmic protein LptC [Syntrophales bacterium]|nr:LPS export ABC transporter periplasmic protein LptC [Syntrophales bacterium]